MTIHLIQHGLQDLHSHYFDETLAWREAFKTLGEEWRCYAHAGLPAALVAKTGAIPAFRMIPDASLNNDPTVQPLADFIESAELFGVDCARALGGAVRGSDVLLVPYATEREMFGAALWLRSVAPAQRPRLAFIIHRPDWDWSVSADRRTVNGEFSYWRYAGKRFRAVADGTATLVGATDPRLAEVMGGLLQMEVRYVPLVTPLPKCSEPRHAEPKAFDIGLPGEFRPERGGAAVAALLAAAARGFPPRRILMQVRLDSERREILEAFQREGVPESVAFDVGNVESDAFVRNVLRCRTLLLPYTPSRYRMRGSGVLNVATALGVPVIVPADTSLADRVHEGSVCGIVYDALNAGVIERLFRMPEPHLAAMAAKARDLAGPWRQRHATETVLRGLLAQLGGA